MKSAWIIAFCLLCALSTQASAGTIFVGAYPNLVLVLDEGTGKVVQSIPLTTGVPRSLRLSQDRKQIYVFTLDHSGIEVIDVATRTVKDHFTLDTPATRYVFGEGIVPDPAGKVLYTVTTEVDKLSDRFEIRKPKYTVIDLTQRKISRAADIAPEDE